MLSLINLINFHDDEWNDLTEKKFCFRKFIINIGILMKAKIIHCVCVFGGGGGISFCFFFILNFNFFDSNTQAFQFIDQDKDGLISKADLRQTFDALGNNYFYHHHHHCY